MSGENALALAVGTIAAFLVGGIWYGALFAKPLARLSSDCAAGTKMTSSVVLFELMRCLLLAAGLLLLLVWTDSTMWYEALGLAVLCWAAFQAAGLAGAVVHEGYPWRIYAIHSGDALAKAIVTSLALWIVAF